MEVAATTVFGIGGIVPLYEALNLNMAAGPDPQAALMTESAANGGHVALGSGPPPGGPAAAGGRGTPGGHATLGFAVGGAATVTASGARARRQSPAAGGDEARGGPARAPSSSVPSGLPQSRCGAGDSLSFC